MPKQKDNSPVVTDAEAQIKINKIYEAENLRIWQLRHQYEYFRKSLDVGATFKAKLASRVSRAASSTMFPVYSVRPAVFTITRRWYYILETTAIDGLNRCTCYVNIKDLWVEGRELVVVPTRMEVIC